MHALTNHAQAFLQSLLEGATDGHHLTDAFHRRAELALDAAKLRQVPSWNLHSYVVECRFEEGRRGLGDRVLQFEETIAQSQLRRDEGKWIARGLGGQRRRAAEAGVYFDDAIVFRLRVEGILHVAFAHDADVSDDFDGQRTQFVVLAIGERLRRSDDNRLSRMDAQWVEVLHVADGDTVVVAVAHHLIFYLFPTPQRFLH